MPLAVSTKLRHPLLGACTLVRVEGTDWIVRVESNSVFHRIPAVKRSEFALAQQDSGLSAATSVAPVIPTRSGPAREPIARTSKRPPTHVNNFATPHEFGEKRHVRRIIESLRVGLPSLDGPSRKLAVGFDELSKLLGTFLCTDVATDGGGALTLMGQYGQGKTFALQMLEDIALDQGFVVVRTEVDATENQLAKPHQLYRDLMRGMRFPNEGTKGPMGLAKRVHDHLQVHCRESCYSQRVWLQQRINCEPLSWLLSEPRLLQRPEFVGLLEADPQYPASRVREMHRIPAQARIWPAFNAGTQGDFGSYLLSGIGVLCRLLGYQGLIIIFDEMEKWHELNWREQDRAGNLLGGLVWAATAELGRRQRGDQPKCLFHSGRCGGYPFSTHTRCYLGLAVAMTPRGDESEYIWSRYGPVQIGQVPRLNDHKLAEYCQRVIPLFCNAYSLELPDEQTASKLINRARHLWRQAADLNTRSGVQAVIASLDEWRDSS